MHHGVDIAAQLRFAHLAQVDRLLLVGDPNATPTFVRDVGQRPLAVTGDHLSGGSAASGCVVSQAIAVLGHEMAEVIPVRNTDAGDEADSIAILDQGQTDQVGGEQRLIVVVLVERPPTIRWDDLQDHTGAIGLVVGPAFGASFGISHRPVSSGWWSAGRERLTPPRPALFLAPLHPPVKGHMDSPHGSHMVHMVPATWFTTRYPHGSP